MKSFITWLTCLSSLVSFESFATSENEYLYRIVSIEQWKESLTHNQIVNSPMDKDFIHLATEEQLARVIQKYWNNKDYIILKLASKKLNGRLVHETNPGGTALYYHLYDGNVPLNAIVEVSRTHQQVG